MKARQGERWIRGARYQRVARYHSEGEARALAEQMRAEIKKSGERQGVAVFHEPSIVGRFYGTWFVFLQCREV